MLASFYQNFLEKYLNKAQLLTLKMLVWLLQNQKQVRIIDWQQPYLYQYNKTVVDGIYKGF
ncbi:hypothetical protein I8748_32430 [Nostoc sp. CENA67]|uniref:Uncharacterized protein n=1 Tax=Amazonocrinis nigriterrae CENA67 TaxID=2794033 RepID=A0A8J7HVK4_9NOST|nr:hypothetical protein [Amazonocrinis nigriterrae]MBH8566803.1 hypothetical protein [Amazonocrinis nigriterrae CENA67]